MESKHLGHYEGTAIVEFLPDGRHVKLRQAYVFIDSQYTRWGVPTGAEVDGASIPRLFWTLIGGPFEGKYRDASIVHDFFCSVRHRPWRAVHRMFYEAMVVSGVPLVKAKYMYAAVYLGGPKWQGMDTANVNLVIDRNKLPSQHSHDPYHSPHSKRVGRDSQFIVYPKASEKEYDPNAKIVDAYFSKPQENDLEFLLSNVGEDTDLDQIDKLMDGCLQKRSIRVWNDETKP
jgi:hypothetical protein